MRNQIAITLTMLLFLAACGAEPAASPTTALPAATPTEAQPLAAPTESPTTAPEAGEPFESPLPTADAFESPISLPNPASKFCEDQGYTLELRTGELGTGGYCIFPDGTECEEWAYFRGECGPGEPQP
jgi:putative hemolysin